MSKATLQLETLTCPSCIQKLEGALKRLDGVQKDTINIGFNSSRVKLDFDNNITTIDEIVATINKLGYLVEKIKVK